MPVLKRTKREDRYEYVEAVGRAARALVPLPSMFESRLRGLASKLHPYRLCMKPGEVHLKALHIFILCFEEGAQREKVVEKLRKLRETLGIHPDLLNILDGSAVLDAQTKALQDELIVAFPGNCKEKTVSIGAFVAALFELRKISGANDVSQCGDVSVSTAVDFCVTWMSHMRNCQIRIWLLERTGFRHKDRLAQQMDLSRQCDKEHPYLDRNRLGLPLSKLLRLYWLFNQPPLAVCETLSASQIAAVFSSQESLYEGVLVVSLFTCLGKLLERCGKNDVLSVLKQKLDPQVTGVTRYEWFVSQSSWHADVAGRIHEALLTVLCRTHYVEVHTRRWRNRVGMILFFLQRHVTEMYALEIREAGTSNGLQLFLETCTHSQAEVACRELALQQKVRNDNVKSQRIAHHAESEMNSNVNFFKIGVASLQGSTSELLSLSSKRILQSIPNKRVEADGTVRRAFTQEEVEAMLHASEQDTRHILLIRILREVGLRAGCIVNLKYGMMLDDSHTPRHVCTVPEKQKSWRSFVTSTALKQAIKSHAETLRQTLEVDSNMYLFYTTNPHKPCCASTIGTMVKRVADNAGILDVHVHPHAFRHTIVGELIDAGNSMEIVSKYMGHRQVSTTAQNYWVPTIMELHEKLQNPFTGQMQQQNETEEELKRDREMLRTKLDAVLRLMHHQNVIFRTAASQGATADEALRRFQTIAPDSEDVLRVVLESSGTSQTGSAAMGASHRSG